MVTEPVVRNLTRHIANHTFWKLHGRAAVGYTHSSHLPIYTWGIFIKSIFHVHALASLFVKVDLRVMAYSVWRI